MAQRELENFGGYRKADELFDFVAADMAALRKFPECYRLISQQVGSADSICSNIEEGYGRESSKEFANFLIYARASARETRGRYHRLRHWLAPDIIETRLALCDEVIGILTATIQTLRRGVSVEGREARGEGSPHSPPAIRHSPR